MEQTLVSTKYQIVIPKKVRKKLSVKPGQRMNIHTVGEQIILSKAHSGEHKNWQWPEDYIKNLKNPWEGEDPIKYLDEERNSWE